jgi:hypothetical protein
VRINRAFGLKAAGRLTSESNLAELDADGEVRKIHQSDQFATVVCKETQGSEGWAIVAWLG